jgi:hypothetical protein
VGTKALRLTAIARPSRIRPLRCSIGTAASSSRVSPQATAFTPRTSLIAPRAAAPWRVPNDASQDAVWTDLDGPLDLTAWTDAAGPLGYDVSANWTPLVPTEMSSVEGAMMTLQPDGSILVSGGTNRRDTYTIKAVTSLQQITGIRPETIKDASLPCRRADTSSDWSGNCDSIGRATWLHFGDKHVH